MPKVAIIENCFMCAEKRIDHSRGKDYCAKETDPSQSDFAAFEDLTGRLLERYKVTGKWGDIPEWCRLPDISEGSANSYTMEQLDHFMWLFKETSQALKQHHGPNKQRRHDCLMGVRMFLRHINSYKEE